MICVGILLITMATTDTTPFPLSWYGLNFLGRPSQVNVQGESPTGGASSIAAIPSGGPGAKGPSPTATPPASAAAPSTGAIQTASDAATGAQGAHGLSETLTKGIPSALSKGPEGIPFLSDSTGNVGQHVLFDPATGAAKPGALIPPSEIGALTAEEGATAGAEAGVGAVGGATAASAALSALGPAALESLGVSMLPQPEKGGVEAAQIALNPATALLFPDVIGRLFSGDFGSFFGGPPPAMAFPSSSWSQIQGQVGKALPTVFPVPEHATPEQRKAVDDANAIIQRLHEYTGPMPSYLSGQQSAESWGNSINTMTQDIKSKFKQLQSLYPLAQQAVNPPPPAPTSTVTSQGFFKGDKTDQVTP